MEQLGSSKHVSVSENFASKLQPIRPGFCHAVRQVPSDKVLLRLGIRNIQFSRVIFEINPCFLKFEATF